MLSNIHYMFSMAWKHQKRVIVFMILSVVVEISLNLTELFAAPVVLNQVENAVPMQQLLLTIGIFTAALVVLKSMQAFFDSDTNEIARIYVRIRIISDLNQKSLMTAYPNTCDPEAMKYLGGAMKATAGNQEAVEYIWTTITNLLIAVSGFVLYLIFLQKLHPFLILVVILTTAAGFCVSRWSDNWYHRNRDSVHKFMTQTDYLRRQPRSIETAKDIRIFGLQNWLTEIYDGLVNAFSSVSRKREEMGFLTDLCSVALVFLRNGIAYAFLLHMTVTENLSTSEFLLYFTAISGFTTWITIILGQSQALYRECVELTPVREYINYPEPFRFSGGKKIPESDSYELKIEDVTFRYPGSEQNLFEHFNLTIHPGEKLAVVGLNGAGKTTLVMLLCGFYDPDEGRILLNGQDIREFNRREYYGLLSAVYQNYSVVDASVAENVAAEIPAPDEKKVWDCLEKAGLAQAVRAFPKQLHTPVGRDVYRDGVLLSGGQTQRLMLARALYKDGPILILDEPTAALDPLAENDIYMKYNEMSERKTSLFISHRLASTRFCDRIIFLKDGRIAEEGTHESLLKQKGEYAKLFEVQARYYQEGREFR